jgi:hypothetical protein
MLATALCCGGALLLGTGASAWAGSRSTQGGARSDSDDPAAAHHVGHAASPHAHPARPPNAAAASTSASQPSLSVSAAALYAPATGQLLYGVAPDRKLAIASTTKLMTALVTVQHIHRLSTMFAQNDWYPAAADSQIGRRDDERAGAGARPDPYALHDADRARHARQLLERV